MANEQSLAQMLAGRSRRHQLRKVTEAERRQWAEQRAEWTKQQGEHAREAREALVDALDARDEAERVVQEALLLALSVNKAEAVRKVLGGSQATFWRRVKAAREAVGE